METVCEKNSRGDGNCQGRKNLALRMGNISGDNWLFETYYPYPGISKISIDGTRHDFSGSGDPIDPATGSAISAELFKVRPDLSAGLYLYSRDYFLGLAAQQVIPQKLQFTDDAAFETTGKLIPHIFLNAGYRFFAYR